MVNAMCQRRGTARLIIIVLALAAAACILSGCGKDGGGRETEAGTAVLPAQTAVSAADAAPGSVSPTDWYAALEGEEKAIADMIIASTDAFNAEDVDAYMSYIDPSSPGYDSTREDTAELFDNYQLIASIDDIKIESVNESKGTATVTVTQTTVRDGKEGKGFAPVQNVLSHELARRGGEWFFRSTTVVSRRELTDRWSMFIDFASNPPVSGTDANEAAEEVPEG